MIVLGLTGSIAMGKSTTADMFRDLGVPVHDADAAVHRLYAGPAAAEIEALFPGTTRGGKVDRDRLGERVLDDAEAMARLEAVVHPMVRAGEEAFLQKAREEGHPLVVLDIPLLFETGAQDRVDAVVVVSATPELQRQRALRRSDMSEAKLEAILRRQMPDAEKRRRADFIVDTSLGKDRSRAAVAEIRRKILSGDWRRRETSEKG